MNKYKICDSLNQDSTIRADGFHTDNSGHIVTVEFYITDKDECLGYKPTHVFTNPIAVAKQGHSAGTE